MSPTRNKSAASRLVVLLLAIAALALTISACGGNDDESSASSGDSAAPASAGDASGAGEEAAKAGQDLPKGLTAGILHVQGTAQSDQLIGYGVEDALDALEIPYSSQDAQGNPAKMASGLDALINKNPSVVFGISVEPATITAQLKKMQQKGIPYINVGGTVAESPLVALSPVPSDYAQSAIATQYLLNTLGAENKESPGTPVGEVASFGFDPIYSLFQRRITFETMVKEAPGVKIVADHQIDFENPTGDIQSATESIVQANPDLKAIYSCCDFTLPPIAAGLRQAGATDKVKVVSAQLADPAVLDLIQKGEIDAVGNAALGASSWMAVDEFASSEAEKREICRTCWMKNEYMFAYSMVDKENVDPSFDLRPDFAINPLIVDYPGYFEAKWKKEYGL
ncbi:MAG TPA: substrate-binding domain-containing protein [Solirubrobacterales bacterium]|nr:substrate-binding domain-containing protein [Solirubrobacterales bacterium]